MKKLLYLLLLFFSAAGLAQVEIKGTLRADDGTVIPYATIIFESLTEDGKNEGTFSEVDGSFKVAIPKDIYFIQFQMIGYESLPMDSVVVDGNLNFGALTMISEVVQLSEIVIRAERSHIESDLGKKTLYIGNDLTNSGATALMAMESLPSVTTTSEGGISIRGSQNVIIYINGRETNRDPRTLQFISADALKKIELITNPSSKYDAEGVAGIINLIYDKAASTKLEVFGNLTVPARISAGVNWSISGDRFSLYLNTNENRSRYETLIDRTRATPKDSLRRYTNNVAADGRGLTRDITAGITYEPDSSLAIGLDINYLRWRDELDDLQQNHFEYQIRNSAVNFKNARLEVEDEVTLSLSVLKELRSGSLNFQITSGGENEINNAAFNTSNVDATLTPIIRPVKFSDETEEQRFHRAKLDYTILVQEGNKLEVGIALNNFNYTIDQAIGFTETLTQPNLFKVVMNKYAGYAQYSSEVRRFEYSLGLRYENFKSKTIQIDTDSTFIRPINNLFPSIQWKYTFNKEDHNLGFSMARRINRPSFWEVSPFISYIDPLNLETGNPYILPEFAYLYEVTYSNGFDKLAIDVTAFRRTTRNVIQQFTEPIDDDRTLLTYRNLGVRNSDGIEASFSYDLNDRVLLEGSASGYRSLFSGLSEDVFFQNKMNWQGRSRQKLKLGKGWTMDISQYFRARRFGVQSFSQAQYFMNIGAQKVSKNKRTTISVSFRDIFDTKFWGYTIVGDDFTIKNREKYQSQRLTVGLRYKIIR